MEDSIDGLWNLTYSESGINKEFFDNYFEGSAKACAYKLGKIKKIYAFNFVRKYWY